MFFLFNRYFSARSLFIYVSEFVLILSSVIITTSLWLNYTGTPVDSLHSLTFNTVAIALIYTSAFYYFDLYKPEFYRVCGRMAVKLAQAILAAFVIMTFVHYMKHTLDRECCQKILINSALLVLLLVGWRTLFGRWLSSEFTEENVLVIGSGELAKKIGKAIYSDGDSGLRLIGFIDEDPSRLGQSIVNPGVIGGYGDIAHTVAELNIDKVIIALPDRRAKLPMSALLACKMKGINIVEGETFQERLTGRIPLDQLKPSWLVFSDGFKSLRSRKIIKRIFDVAVSVIGLILSFPIMVVTALIIKLESKGPILFSQVRVGEQGREFKMFKFRSMSSDAEKQTGPVWAISNDDRVTRVGRVIRKLRIDELPQLMNVIKGDMSFVGPRPERPFFVEQLKEVIPYYEIRSVIKPGITGWAQVKYPYGASVEDALEKLQFDMYYIKNLNIFLDVMIILWTVKVVLGRIGSR
ncbi:MAG: TIGR03013 family XrtA/PEP-CTERM system glycosyltransferase [Nitrospinota bacterium]